MAVLFLCMLSGAHAHAAPSDDFRSGTREFTAGNYDQALQAFLAAQDGGMETPTLRYNLGATYHRLGRADEALVQFGRLATDPDWAPLAHYNMGVIEEGRGRMPAALDHYRISYDRAQAPNLKALAAARIEALPIASAATRDRPGWTGLVSLGAGHDDNVLLTDSQDPLGPSNQKDGFAEVILHAGRYVSGGYERGWRLDLGGYYRSYSSLDDYNYGVANVRAQHSRQLSTWYVDTGGKLEFQTSGGEYLATVGSWELQGLHAAGPFILRLRNEINYFEPGQDYDFIGGWQTQSGIDVSHRSRTGRLRFGYELELNLRKDRVSGSEFTSYSPVRHRAFADLSRSLTPRLRLDGRIELRSSRYSDANQQMDAGSVLVATKRRDERILGSVRLAYGSPSGWKWFADFQQSANDSNLAQYAYDNRQFGAGVEITF